MSVADKNEKKFVIKHVFKNIGNLIMGDEEGDEMIGPVEEHFGVKWRLRLFNGNDGFIDLNLDCLHTDHSRDWSIETMFDAFSNWEIMMQTKNYTFSKDRPSNYDTTFFDILEYQLHSTNDEASVEFHVTIKKMTGIEKKKLRNFDDDTAKEYSDVVLKIGDQKFYVIKNFLAMHTTYFQSMFFGKFAEAQKPEIELKDIDPVDFQNFLELINGESLVTDCTVEGILHLADFFGAKTAIKRCHNFLLKQSELSEKKKFELAIKCGFEDVKKKCLSAMKTKNDVKSVLPDDPNHFQPTIWAELLEKLCTLG